MTTNKETAIAHAPTEFLKAVNGLLDANAQFNGGALASVPFSRIRQDHLAKALQELATMHAVSLQLPLQIDSNGEFSIVALMEGKTSGSMGCGEYGSFAEVLNPYRPRCGALGYPPATLDECDGWCHLNHFEAEKMVLAQHDALLQTHPELFAPAAG